jgi:DNA-3-methyladenine glycosylase
LNSKLAEILNKTSVDAAPLLLGCTLNRQTQEGVISLKIVEVEAYHQDDPASHSYSGITKRTAPMYKSGGHIYVYFTYGMHYCLNIVVGESGVGEAVLIRAGEPIKGVEIMRKNRGVDNIQKLANGPGKLAQALGINDTLLSGEILNKSSIYIEQPEYQVNAKGIIASPRIGITKATDIPWRFYIKNNPFVSKRNKKQSV